jgi:hypothetical protein
VTNTQAYFGRGLNCFCKRFSRMAEANRDQGRVTLFSFFELNFWYHDYQPNVKGSNDKCSRNNPFNA